MSKNARYAYKRKTDNHAADKQKTAKHAIYVPRDQWKDVPEAKFGDIELARGEISIYFDFASETKIPTLTSNGIVYEYIGSFTGQYYHITGNESEKDYIRRIHIMLGEKMFSPPPLRRTQSNFY